MVAAVTFAATASWAQDPPPAGPEPQAQAPEGGGAPRPGREPEIRPYERVITKDAV